MSLGVLYAGVVGKLVGDWATDDNYSHGFLIVPLALVSRSLKRRSSADLQAELRGKASLAPNVLLMELRRRGRGQRGGPGGHLRLAS